MTPVPAPPVVLPAAEPLAAPSVLVAPPLWRDYLTLTKPEISFLVALSALAGYVLGAPAGADGLVLTITLLGVTMTSAGACAMNHYLERDLDRQMKRTARRPLPDGRISAPAARRFGLGLILGGIGLLCPLVNPLTAGLAILTVVLYLQVYTPMKRTTKYNTLVGTLPGALPALGGYTAATGGFGAGGWAVFAILVTWQMPHFLSLAWMYRKDYDRAAYAMLPVLEPDGRSTVRQTLGFTLALLAFSLTPALFAGAGLLYTVGAVLLGLWFLRPTLRFYHSRTVQDARKVLKGSVVYIPLLVLLLVVDWLVRLA